MPALERVAIAEVKVGADRLRKADPAKVDAIAHSYGLVGQLQPIKVIRAAHGELLLNIGLTRLMAARKVGWSHIDALVVPITSMAPGERRLAEVFENLIRADLTALDRAIFLAELKDVHEQLHPETKHGAVGGRGGKKNETAIFAFSIETAEQTGMSRRSIEVAVAIAKGLGAEVRTRLQGTWLAEHQSGLKTLSEQPEKTQQQLLDILFATPPGAASVADALVIHSGKRLPTAAESRFRSLSDGLARCSAKDRAKLFALHEAEVLEWAKKRLGRTN